MEFKNETKIFPNRAQDLSVEFLFYYTTNGLKVNGVNNVFYKEIDPTFSGGASKNSLYEYFCLKCRIEKQVWKSLFQEVIRILLCGRQVYLSLLRSQYRSAGFILNKKEPFRAP